MRWTPAKQTIGTLLVPLVVVAAWELVWRRPERAANPDPHAIQSLAVLHLENLSGDPSQDYFADAMTDELITCLGQIGALRVISRTSVMQYKGVHKPLPQIARELNVDAIIEGTVVHSGNQVRVTAQLIQAPADKHMWAQAYEGDPPDVLTLQRQIAAAIAGQRGCEDNASGSVDVSTSSTLANKTALWIHRSNSYGTLAAWRTRMVRRYHLSGGATTKD
jgi:TolB-like protein